VQPPLQVTQGALCMCVCVCGGGGGALQGGDAVVTSMGVIVLCCLAFREHDTAPSWEARSRGCMQASFMQQQWTLSAETYSACNSVCLFTLGKLCNTAASKARP
jgi:hypothetical protein